MEAATSLVCSKVSPFGFTFSPKHNLTSFRHFNKQVKDKNLSVKISLTQKDLNLIRTPLNSYVLRASKSGNPPGLSLKSSSKWSLNLLFNPFFWTYFSWTWLFWPWLVAIGLAIYGLYSLNKHLRGEASVLEQLAIVTSAFTWLTLVPPAHFNGFLEGWPFVFFFVYHYFFFLNVSVRKRLYGDYYPRKHDTKWDISLPNWHKLLFCVGVMVGHWLAACEGTELHLIPGGWNNVGIWLLIMLTVFMQYHSTLYLAKYSEKVVVPTAVVQFGPYRFIRHPIYASTMLLFVTYFTALRAPMSALFIVAVCFMYYEQKAKLEEALMLETFGERYTEYMDKVRYKFLPFVY
ncbi:protein C-terminal S-isoprenylcysteine carboxyl O-methyltransferase [Forsythia ovata]|uniref:Protein C-terminal S-isoprenylcysteine carboxyl O-methyltransferase n=1 Tax=Forsythia ovata TaxID=205694 RepID=A0ABD1RKK0_9LAMI